MLFRGSHPTKPTYNKQINNEIFKIDVIINSKRKDLVKQTDDDPARDRDEFAVFPSVDVGLGAINVQELLIKWMGLFLDMITHEVINNFVQRLFQIPTRAIITKQKK